MAKVQEDKTVSTPQEQLLKARVLCDFQFDGVLYRHGQVMEAAAEAIAALGSQVDAHPDAVAYAEGLK
jgi:hypothetical protein